jgi:uncharacterized protein YegP (UPF0339 family)
MKVQIFKDKSLSVKNNWRWRIKANNNKIICISGEGFFNKSNAKRSIKNLIKTIQAAKV